jgi:hypothetical protein
VSGRCPLMTILAHLPDVCPQVQYLHKGTYVVISHSNNSHAQKTTRRLEFATVQARLETRDYSRLDERRLETSRLETRPQVD